MTAPVLVRPAARSVAIPSDRPSRDPSLELERVSRLVLGCAAVARPEGLGWQPRESLGDRLPGGAPGAVVITYAAPDGTTTLADAMADPVAPERAARLLSSLAEALATIHDLGVAHGHLRPELIAVHGDDVRVLGFGVEPIARVLGGVELATAVLPERYRAPEQPSAASVWTDTYAFGVIAAELVGAAPSTRAGELLARAAAAGAGQRPPDLRRFARELAEALTTAAPQPAGETPAPEPAPPEPAAEMPEPRPPPPPPIAPPPVSRRGSAVPLLAMGGGALLMVIGVAVLFVIAVARADRSAPAPTVATATAPAPVTSPPALPDAGAAPPAPSVPSDDDSDAEAPPPSIAPPDAARASAGGPGVSAADGSAEIPIDESVPVWGPADAPATLVVFGDLECPHTRRALDVLVSLKLGLADDLRLAWRHRPLDTNRMARGAAELAAAVHAEHGADSFWRVLRAAAKDRGAPSDDRLERWIEQAGGDPARVRAARAKHAGVVARDLELAGRFDVRATPTFYLNGIRIDGLLPRAELRQQLDREILVARSALAAGIEPAALYATRVRKNLVGLGPEIALRTCPELGDSPARGGGSPLVTIVEFSDFQCPYCKRVQPALERVLSRYGGDVRLVWKNLPLASHARARPAAALALEALQRGGSSRFWRAHDLLFDAASDLSDAALEDVARRAGMESASALGAVRRGDHDRRIDDDVRLAKKLGATGTPTFFLNGRKLEGAVPFSKLSAIVEQEIDAARRLVDNGTPRARIYEAVCGAR